MKKLYFFILLLGLSSSISTYAQTDSDEDGVNDVDDRDDDNDGTLDIVELPTVDRPIPQNPSDNSGSVTVDYTAGSITYETNAEVLNISTLEGYTYLFPVDGFSVGDVTTYRFTENAVDLELYLLDFDGEEQVNLRVYDENDALIPDVTSNAFDIGTNVSVNDNITGQSARISGDINASTGSFDPLTTVRFKFPFQVSRVEFEFVSTASNGSPGYAIESLSFAKDTDNDGVINSLDLDSDNDGVPDIVEAGGVDSDNNGVVDGTFSDGDDDGWADTFDSDNGGLAINGINKPIPQNPSTDNVGTTVDYAPGSITYETNDTSNTAIFTEGGYTYLYPTTTASSGNVITYSFNANAVDLELYLVDFDAKEDVYLRVYDENDNLIPDVTSNAFEIGGSVSVIDDIAGQSARILGTVDASTGSFDASITARFKFPFQVSRVEFEFAASEGGTPGYIIESLGFLKDTDDDGVIDPLDLDSDNDGITDILEAGGVDSDNNGVVDGTFTDGDNDGWLNTFDSNNSGTALADTNTDGTGLPDRLSLDSDADGCSDANEAFQNATADGSDNLEYGTGTGSGIVNENGLVSAAVTEGYNGTSTGRSNAVDDTVTEGCVFTQTSNGNWNSTAVWREGAVPTSTNDARIADNVTSTVTQDQAVGNLFTNTGSTVTINDSFSLAIKEDLTNNGNFEGPGFVVFDGSSAQQIIGDGTDAGSFSNIRLDNSNGLTLTDDAEITDVLDIDSGDFRIQNSGADVNFLTFKSNANKTAILANANDFSNDVEGCVVVERYIPAKRAFRFLSSPVNTVSGGCDQKPSINDNLQEGEQVTNRFEYTTATDGTGTMVGNPDFGTHITGFATPTASDEVPANRGFDATQTGNPSMFYYENDDQAFDPAFRTTVDALNSGSDFLLMVRGGRDMDLNISSNTQLGDETVLRFTGELLTGAVVPSDLNQDPSPTPDGTNSPVYNAIGNPYQAQVDIREVLNDVNTNGVVKTRAYVYDPTIGDGSSSFGGYVTLDFDASTGAVTATPNTLGSGDTPNAFLQANQAMFVENEVGGSGTVSIRFEETHKSDTTDEGLQIFSTAPSTDLTVAMDLYESTNNNLRDGILVKMSDAYSDGYVQQEEAMKFYNLAENLSISNLNMNYSIEKRNLSDDGNEVVQLYLENYSGTNYTFKVSLNNPENKTVYLVDNYLGTQTLLDVPYYEHNFSVDESVPASVATDRFELIFDNTTLGNDTFELTGIEIYPNPVKDILHLEKGQFNGELNAFSIYDITGKLVMSNTLELQSELNIDMSTLSKGLYILELNTSKGQFQQKLIKE